jgi:LPS-assembly lipoprotein
MSLLDPVRRWRILGAALLTAGLAGCIQPLYAPVDGYDVAAELRAVAIDPIPERLGHYLHNELILAFDGTGGGAPVKYRLVVTPKERVLTPLVDTFSGRANSASVEVDAEYKLIPEGGGEPLASGVAQSNVNYDRSAQRFANIRAARDSEIRLAKLLADQIRTRVAAKLVSGR